MNSRFLQQIFARRRWVKFSSLALVSILLIASFFWIWLTLTTPVDIEEREVLVNYEHSGQFGYSIYMQPSHLYGSPQTGGGGETGKNIYFRNIINTIDISYNYKFAPERPVEDVTTTVNLVAIVKGPSGWHKTYHLHNITEEDSNVTIPLRLDLEDFESKIDTIENELGFGAIAAGLLNPYNITIQASVSVSANTEKGVINDTFVQPMGISVGRGILEWDKQVSQSKTKIFEDLVYQHLGNYQYTLSLKSNSLYETGTLHSAAYNEPSLIIRPEGGVYFTKIIDVMKGNFSYEFISDEPVNNLVEEMEVTAVLEFPDTWTKKFTLVPRTVLSGPFTVSFPVDILYYIDLGNIIGDEIGRTATTYGVTITASVHTTGITAAGPIDEVFIHSLKGALGTGSLVWGSELYKSEKDTITRTNIIHDPNVYIHRALSMVVTLLVFLCFSFVVWNAIQAGIPLFGAEREARRAKKKYKNIIVDVTELPPIKGDEVVIRLNSVDEMVRVADSLLKPVLHQVVVDMHIYYVIDGLIRYEYISGLSS